MLDTSTAKKAPAFIKGIDNTQYTGETVRVKAVLGRHKEADDENGWLRKGPSTSPTDNETSEVQNTKLDWQLTKTPALTALKELANHAVEEAEKRYRQDSLTVAILETMASGKPLEEDTEATREVGAIAMLSMPSSSFKNESDVEVTCYEMPVTPKSDSGSYRMPRKYQNATVAPYTLIVDAIIENKRYMGKNALPSKFYASDVLIFQLHKDIKICRGEDFNGHSIPYNELDGRKVYIPILSAKAEKDLDLPADTVWYYSGIES